MRRYLPAIVAFLLAVAALAPSALSAPQDTDESQYTWTAAYYGNRLARLDFATEPGLNPWLDPSWNPWVPWTLTQPMGTRLLYAAVILPASLPIQPVPHLAKYKDGQPVPQPEARVPEPTITAVRLFAVLCSALGLALLAFRFRWVGVIIAALVLSIPHVRIDLSLAWAEGPLMLGFGLCVATYGTRWFPVACAIAASFKLTGLAVWPLLLLPGALGPGTRPRWLLVAPTVWTLLNPPSWFAGGPAYILILTGCRILEELSYTSVPTTGVIHTYLPSRYLWPLELLALLVLVWTVRRSRACTQTTRSRPMSTD